jgi:hypothetical protein
VIAEAEALGFVNPSILAQESAIVVNFSLDLLLLLL